MRRSKKQENESGTLERLARAHGIQTSYVDNLGRTQFASAETMRLLLERLGASEEGPQLAMIDPVVVYWQKSKAQLSINVPASEISRSFLRLTLEDGSDECIPVREITGVGERKGNAEKIASLRLDIPELPTGYHSVAIETPSGRSECLLISAPRKLYANPQRQWGAFLPLYAAHSEESWGAGNFSDWRNLCRWIGSLGGSVAGTLPVMSAFLEQPVCEPSPYSPASRLFWNEFFIDITAVPEFQSSATAQKIASSTGFRRKISEFRSSEFIEYREQWAARRQVLEAMASDFFQKPSARYAEFRAFLSRRPEVEEYAQFRAMCDVKKTSWHQWPDAAKSGRLAPSDIPAALKSFYLYIQWLAHEQIDSVLATCREVGVKFYLDLPLGVHPDGFDAWRFRNFFAPQVSAGAPPDSFFTKGQDWGFAPLHPRRTRELKYKYVIDYLRFQMRHTGLLRIDHVMGLHRLWWVPHGHPASAGAYVSYPAHELYAILSVESHRHQTTLVGENLGTVPPEVNKSMDRHGLRRMYVLQYEQGPKGSLRAPERPVVASLNTHDMPSFAAYWKGLDIADRADLGLLAPKQVAAERRNRAAIRQRLIQLLRKKRFLKTARPRLEQVCDAVLRLLAESKAETVLVTLEDLWSEERSQNVPGTSKERPNWRRKSRRTLEELGGDEALGTRLQNVMRRG